MESSLTPGASSNFVLTYQPIIDVAQHSVAVELLHAPAMALGQDAEAVMARLIIDAFIHSGLDAFTRDRRVYLPMPGKLLDSDLLTLLPARHFSLVVDISRDELPVERCRALVDAGFSFVLGGGVAAGNRLAALLSCTDAVRFSAEEALDKANAVLMRNLRGATILMASGVDQPGQFVALREAGFRQFQGYYFAHPAEVTGTRADPRKLAVVDALARVSMNAENREVEAVFRATPALTIDLLRLVNSAAIAPNLRIRSIRQALTIMGRDQLRRWLQVLLYSIEGDDAQRLPLMDLALRRAAFLERVLGHQNNTITVRHREEAFMVGLLSLADVLLQWPMAKVVDRLGVATEVRGPLLERAGVCGLLLNLCEMLELGDFAGVDLLAEELGLPMSAVMQAQGEALAWAHEVASGQQDEAETGEDTQ
ncbi:MAG: HDOD domain-containing protein [Rhodocyclaceae bacterium]|nr:HDOD domain-containing protein [Rhodocyclaceae bacterium]